MLEASVESCTPIYKYVLCDFAYVIGPVHLLHVKIHDLK
jgi:hypothetical protein